MGNQQETVSEAEYGWLAGIIDGEGSISINRSLSHRTTIVYCARVQVPNTNQLIIDKARSIFDRLGAKGHVEKRQYGNNMRWKICSIITLNSAKDIEILLPLIIPYLVGKKRHAEILYRFVHSRLQRRSERKQTITFASTGRIATSTRFDKYNAEEISCYDQLVFLNKKGRETDSSETTRQTPSRRRVKI